MIEKQNRFMTHLASLILFAQNNGFKITGGELYRTQEQQDIYIQQGKSKTKYSKHIKRLAIDLNFFKNDKLTYEKEELQFIGDYWEGLHPDNKWGGNWNTLIDTPHFQTK